MFIDSQIPLDYDSQITDKYFAEYIRIKVKQFKETLLQRMSNVKMSVVKRTHHQRQYDRRVNTRHMQTQKRKHDLGKALDVGLVVTESSRIEPEKHDISSMLGNDADANNADIKPIYDDKPIAEVQLTTERSLRSTENNKNFPLEVYRNPDYIPNDIEGFDPLALVEGFTLAEDNIGLLVTLGVLPDDVTMSANRTIFFLLIGVTATNFLL
nr:hypothetical protein [Tanacetum cinerariifolium]